MAQTHQEWKEELCRALGLDPRMVARLELTLTPTQPVTLTAVIHPDKSAAVVTALREAGKHVEWITIDETQAASEHDL